MIDRIKYLQQVISTFTNHEISEQMVIEYFIEQSEDFTVQDWIVDNLKPEYLWMTGLSILEAAQTIVEESYSNGNIK